MKKFIVILLSICFAFNANAQLKPPTITHRDTLVVIGAEYNCGSIDFDDMPTYIIEETPVALYVAGEIYKKGTPTVIELNTYKSSWEGHIDYYEFGNATVNGKKAEIAIVRPREDCKDSATKFVIDDYVFYAKRLEDFAQMMDLPVEAARIVVNGTEAKKKAQWQ